MECDDWEKFVYIQESDRPMEVPKRKKNAQKQRAAPQPKTPQERVDELIEAHKE